ncbi:substrate-binding domain-containing protein [Psychromonas aquimarina]|uniref:ABC transporter substrate-binding protein n=1 Tax=Psychromonas aquimarina TaxID=444919 RepID=UPI000687B448|nr:substrate-binding domain-containing protein [Psychromonas aquimarina]
MNLLTGRLAQLMTAVVLFFSVELSVSAKCIAVVTAGGGQSFWGEVIRGAVKAGQELNINIYARGVIDEVNREGQGEIIQSIINKGCRALVLAPNSTDRIKDVARLKELGIATVYIDRDMGGERLSVIKTENYAAGRLAGREMAKALQGQGQIAVLRLSKEVLSTTLRENGFIEGAVQGGLEIVVDQYIGTMVGDARAAAYQILRLQKQIDGIFTPNESTSIGVSIALKRINRAENIIHIGFDAHRIMVNSVKDAQMYGFVMQNPFRMGYEGVTTAYRAMRGLSVEEYLDTGVIFVGQKNINSNEIMQLLGESE